MDEEEMIGWLNSQALRGRVSIRSIRDCNVDDLESNLYRDGMRICLFTVISQHVYGKDLWEAVNNAVQTARTCK